MLSRLEAIDSLCFLVFPWCSKRSEAYDDGHFIAEENKKRKKVRYASIKKAKRIDRDVMGGGYTFQL